MRNFHRLAQGKLTPQWLLTSFMVVAHPQPGQPVNSICPEGKSGPVYTIHRKNLWPYPKDNQWGLRTMMDCIGEAKNCDRELQSLQHWWDIPAILPQGIVSHQPP